jgi:hypothetical protein
MVNHDNPLPGNEAIEKAKELKGKPTQKTLIIKYSTEEELIGKLEQELAKLKSD